MLVKVCRYLFVLACFVLPQYVAAQYICGVVVDEQTNEPLSDVSVKMSIAFRQDGRIAGKIIFGTKTNQSGFFEIRNRYIGRMEYETNYIGYRTLRSSFIVSGYESDTLSLDTLRLRPSDLFKNTAVVKGHYQRFFMRGDTVIFNPKAFKLEEGARLEELIEKLDGVSVDENGVMSWMGKPLRILVNGEDFMNGNQGIMNVLPAIAVDKIKIYNKASTYTERTGKDDGTEDKVLDLQIQPGWFEKWYGTAEATYQTTDKYEGAFDAMRLSNHLPSLVFLDVNNRNNLRDKSMRGTSWMTLGGNGKAQSGAFSIELRQDTTVADSVKGTQRLRRRTGGSVSLPHFDEVSSTYSTKENFSPDQLHTYTLTDKKNYKHNFNPKSSLYFNHDFNKQMSLRISGNLEYGYSNANSENRSSIFDDQPYDYSANPRLESFSQIMGDSLQAHLLTRNRTRTSTQIHAGRGDLNVHFSYLFADGSNLGINPSFSYSKSDNKNLQAYHIDYFKMNTHDYSLHQSEQDDETSKFYVSVWYNKSFTEKLKLSLAYNLKFNTTTQNNKYQMSNNEGATWTEDFSNSYYDRVKTLENSLAFILFWKSKSWDFKPMLTLKSLSEHETYQRGSLDTTTTRKRWLPSPAFNVKVRLNKTSSLEWYGSHEQTQPKLLNTLNYIDTTDPLSIRLGNPTLRNSKCWETNLRYSATFSKSQFLLNSMIGFTCDVDPIVAVWAYDPLTGVNTTWNANAHNGQKWNASLDLDKSFTSRFHTSNIFSISHQKNYGFLANTAVIDNVIEACTKQFLLKERYSLTYDNNDLSAEIHGSLNYLKAKNIEAGMDNNFWDYDYGFNCRLKFGKWTFRTDMYNRGRRGYNSSDYNGNRLIWDASASWRCLKGKGELSVDFSDILNQDKDYYASVSAYERLESGSKTLHHYFCISFTWNFDAVGGKKNPW